MRPIDAVVEFFPELSQTKQIAVLWDFTAYPFGNYAIWRKQAKHHRKLLDAGKTPCVLCGRALRPYEVRSKRADCYRCRKALRQVV